MFSKFLLEKYTNDILNAKKKKKKSKLKVQNSITIEAHEIQNVSYPLRVILK